MFGVTGPARLALAVALAVAGVVAWSAPAAATPKLRTGSPVVCPPFGPCVIVAQQPGSDGSRGDQPVAAPVAGPATTPCVFPRGSADVVPCFDPAFGWLNKSNGCYYLPVPAPDPNSTVAAAEGGSHLPGDGAYYLQTCSGIVGPRPGALGLVQGVVWQQAPPPGFGGARPDPAVLAQQAVAELGLAGPNIRLSPPVGSRQVVGLPTWMWTTVGPGTWTAHSATAAVPGESVTATATAVSIDWSMGDGHTVTCRSPGTPYAASYGPNADSPTCGYTYSLPSSTSAGDTFPVTGTTTWQVTWAGGGQTGALTVRRSSTVRVLVVEAEAVNQ